MRTLLVSLTLLVLTVQLQARADDDPEPPGDLHVAINKGIRLLEKKEYQKFLQTFVIPDDLKQFTKESGIARFADDFAEDETGRSKAATVLKLLKAARNSKPTWHLNGQQATFSFEKSIKELPNRITFIKIQRRWHIQNS